MTQLFVSNGGVRECRLLYFMGAGGPEAQAEAAPEPLDRHRETLDEIEGLIDESDRHIDNLDTGLDDVFALLAERVEDVADASRDRAHTVVNQMNGHLLDRVGNIRETIRVLLQETRSVNREEKENVRSQRGVNVTDPRASELAREGVVLSRMSSQLAKMTGRQLDTMVTMGNSLDASLEDQEGAGHSPTWEKTGGGTGGGAQGKRGLEGEQYEEEQGAFEPSSSAEKNMKDLILAMKIANSEATGQVDGAAAFQALSAEFSSMEPSQQDAFIAWMNEQIGGFPYKASRDSLSGTLRFDRSA